MLLYRYMSLSNLWHVLDVIVGERIHCATWNQLNDPLEGSYELYFSSLNFEKRSAIERHLSENRESWRIAAFSTDPHNFLLWSHYADGHKWVALEIEFDDDDPDLKEIVYSPFSPIFDEETDISMSYPHVFLGKTVEWAYEEEWRIVSRSEYVSLKYPCQRVLLGPRIEPSRAKIPKQILRSVVNLVPTHINMTTMKVKQGEP